MGAGESVYVQKQEAFVRENREAFRRELKGYSQAQVDGKLRQLYAGTDRFKENEWSYVNPTNWNKARSAVIVSHPKKCLYL
jgi:hypothetical protein